MGCDNVTSVLGIPKDRPPQPHPTPNAGSKPPGFPSLKTLDTLDFAAQPGINKPLVLELARGDYLDVQENVLFMGNPGTGKTHLATALGHSACAQGKRVRFFTVTGLVTQLLEAREERQLERLFNRLSKYHLIILDEFGYVPFTKAGAELLFEVVSRAYERQSILLTTNLPFSQWERTFKDPMTTAAAIDRLVHHSVTLELNIDSYRMAAAQRKKKGEKQHT